VCGWVRVGPKCLSGSQLPRLHHQMPPSPTHTPHPPTHPPHTQVVAGVRTLPVQLRGPDYRLTYHALEAAAQAYEAQGVRVRCACACVCMRVRACVCVRACVRVRKPPLHPPLRTIHTQLVAPYRGVIVTNPHNPLGMAFAPAELRDVLLWARERRAHVLADEIYALSGVCVCVCVCACVCVCEWCFLYANA
jgi:hypothetical protein